MIKKKKEREREREVEKTHPDWKLLYWFVCSLVVGAIIINSRTNSVQIGIIFICLIRAPNNAMAWWHRQRHTEQNQKKTYSYLLKNPRNVQNEHFFSIEQDKSIVFVAFCSCNRIEALEKATGKQTATKTEKKYMRWKTKADRWKWITQTSHCGQQLKKRQILFPLLQLCSSSNFKMRNESTYFVSRSFVAMNECVFDFTALPVHVETRYL